MKTIAIVTKTSKDMSEVRSLILSLGKFDIVKKNRIQSNEHNIRFFFLNLEDNNEYNLRGYTLNILYFIMEYDDVPKVWIDALYPMMYSVPNSKILASSEFDLKLMVL